MGNHPPFPSMPFMADFAPLLQLFKGLPRKGPGSEASTLRALGLCHLPANPVVADLGCGSGASTVILARALQVPILALDADGLSLDDLWEITHALGLGHLVTPQCGDMAHPDIEPGSLDLLWSEGAIAHVGWASGLQIWRELLKPGGLMALTDATWFTDDPPEEARQAWASWYPEMGTAEDHIQAARELGLDVVGHFPLPPQDWWAYFVPVAARFDPFSDKEDMRPCIAGLRAEIDLYHRCGCSYGYEFYILRRR